MGRWVQKQSEREPQDLEEEWEQHIAAAKVAAEESHRERERRRQHD